MVEGLGQGFEFLGSSGRYARPDREDTSAQAPAGSLEWVGTASKACPMAVRGPPPNGLIWHVAQPSPVAPEYLGSAAVGVGPANASKRPAAPSAAMRVSASVLIFTRAYILAQKQFFSGIVFATIPWAARLPPTVDLRSHALLGVDSTA